MVIGEIIPQQIKGIIHGSLDWVLKRLDETFGNFWVPVDQCVIYKAYDADEAEAAQARCLLNCVNDMRVLRKGALDVGIVDPVFSGFVIEQNAALIAQKPCQRLAD